MRRIPRLSRPIDRLAALDPIALRRPQCPFPTTSTTTARAPFSTTRTLAAEENDPPKRNEFLERLRSKLWGTDHAPGREDPYSAHSPMRVSTPSQKMKPQKKKRAQKQQADAADAAAAEESEGEAKTPARQEVQVVREEDATYEPARTWHGLKWVGGEGVAWQAEKEFTPPVRTTLEPRLALKQALIEVFAARSEGASLEGIYDGKGKEDGSVVGVELTAAADGSAVIKKAEAVAEGQAAEGQAAVDVSREEARLWRGISLRDPAIKFAVVKRVMQLAGIRITDPVIAQSNTAGILLDSITRRPPPAKLFEKLDSDKKLAKLRNVKISPRRITPIDNERQIGRWKIIEQKLQSKNLPVTGHNI
ncbi:ribosomal protein l50 mitochondria protein [Diplodia corticola]|uniref:Large ribosomal subunit protein mL50 n=1 Tax=Diplodia corticola TaxID=236234 RepID=A0A1J9S0G4_9PEZI|nr:ribosomal protein l50 mitochondria protein [Diplodia corticola]OJD33165.1 ribosomal protein l50 mitochondria protein [Diplodia corticola]